MREVEWSNGPNTPATKGIAFPCRDAKCTNEVKVDANHPDYEHFKTSPVAHCNDCLRSRISTFTFS